MKIIPNDYSTYPPEGVECIVTDGKHYDTAYFIRSGEYKWLKINYAKDNVSDFNSFVPTDWIIPSPYDKL